MAKKRTRPKPAKTAARTSADPKNLRRHTGLAISAAYVVVAVVVGLRFHVMADGQSGADFLGSYVTQARSFLGGAVAVDPYRGPLYPIILGLLHLVTRSFGAGLFETGIVLSALSAGVVLFVTFELLKSLFAFQTALVVIGLLVTNPVFVRYSYTTGNDMFFAAMATLTVFILLRPGELRWPWVVAAGTMSALAYLTRYNGVAILVAVVATVALVNIWRLRWRSRMLASLVLALCFLACITPWGLFCKQKVGHFFYNRNYENIAYGFYLEEGYADRFAAEHAGEFNSFADVVAYDPARFFGALPTLAYGQLTGIMGRVLTWPVGIVALLGTVFLFIRPPDRRQLAYYLTCVPFAGVLLLVFFAERFTLFLIPMLLALAVEGLRHAATYIKSKKRTRLVFAACAVAMIGYGVVATAIYNKPRLKGGSIAFRQLGEWFTKTVPAHQRGSVVAARKPHFGYFAGLKTVDIPIANSYEELMRYLHERDADYLFFSTVAAQMREELAYLSVVRDPKQAPPGLTLMAATSVGALYKIEK